MVETKEKMTKITPKELVEVMVKYDDISPEDIYAWALMAEDALINDEEIKLARQAIKEDFEYYNSLLGYEENMESEFWDAIFDMYEDALAGTLDLAEAWKEALANMEEADADGTSATKEEVTEEDIYTLGDLIEALVEAFEE